MTNSTLKDDLIIMRAAMWYLGGTLLLVAAPENLSLHAGIVYLAVGVALLIPAFTGGER